MNKRLIQVAIVALGIVCSVALQATTSQFRSPLSLERGPMHLELLDDFKTTAWFCADQAETCCQPLWCDIELQAWTGAYYRSADRSFFVPGCPNKISRKTASLSALFFGAESFTASQAFPGGAIVCQGINELPIPTNSVVFLNFAALTPRFTYSEGGVYFGLQAWKDFCPCWRVGGRLSIPFKVIEVRQNVPAGGSIEESISNVVQEVPFNLENSTPPLDDFAFRLDFLSCLFRPASGNISLSEPLVRYGPTQNGNVVLPTQMPGNATIIGVPASNSELPDVYLVKSVTGNLPPRVPLNNPNTPPAGPIFTYGKQHAQVTGVLPADGSGVDGGVYFFGDASVDYRNNLALDPAAQRTLFVVPHITDNGDEYTDNTVAIQNAIDDVVRLLALYDGNGAVDQLLVQGIDLTATQRVVGNGDLRAEGFVGYHITDVCGWGEAYIDGVLGIVFPTGKRDPNAELIYYQTTGNNGHFEFKLGIEAGWRPYDWFGCTIDTSFNHVFRRTERRNAPFVDATVKNFGPQVDAKVSWNYGIFRFDMDFFNPCNTDLGVTLGYELWAKSKDDVTLCQTTAETLIGTVGQLDPTILESRTNSLTNKLRGEVFYRRHFFEIFGGASQVVSGRNAMKESEIHLGFALYF